jgi:hypothetical protein
MVVFVFVVGDNVMLVTGVTGCAMVILNFVVNNMVMLVTDVSDVVIAVCVFMVSDVVMLVMLVAGFVVDDILILVMGEIKLSCYYICEARKSMGATGAENSFTFLLRDVVV